ncbi:unnamed protein product [Rotaria socialis]|uniref:CipC-like antibiotic response protein n=1 Tax=Rotaria socialis TaxID=392032 RepID=A0A817UE87_9BILA|nr:unnamed protein product [Rotaria socialis]CAF4766585.1 unnamed protein product [Rotaria socialis]
MAPALSLSDSEDAYNNVYADEPDHKSSWTHELVAGAAGFAAMKAYEDHCRDTGETVSHGKMKELLAGFAAAEADNLVETQGLDFLDREKLKIQPIHQAHALAKEKYGEGQVGPGSEQ